MGGGNACKSATRRERNVKNAPGEAKSQLKTNQNALTNKCSVCMQAFMPTQNKTQLQGHVEAKHPKSTFEQCFPTYQE